MNVWLVTIGEPLPVGEGVHDRPLRTGYFSKLLTERGHTVTWWTSTFDHGRRRLVTPADATIEVERGLTLRLLHGGGYRRNVSLARLRDHRRIATKFAAEIAKAPRPDVILCSLPPVEICAAAVDYGRRTSVAVVLDMRDMWPDIFVEAFPRPVRPAARIALAGLFAEARRVCSAATAITGITDAMLDWGVRRAGRARTALDAAFPMGYQVRVPTPERLREAEAFWDERGVMGGDGRPVFCFFGSLGRQFDLVPVVGAARLLAQRGVPARFVLCGAGERLAEYRRLAQDLPEVVLPGWVDEAKIHVLLRRSYAGIDPLPNRFDYLASINNKAIEYLSAGVPVISSPAHGVLAEFLARAGCGASCEPGSAHSLASLVERAYSGREHWAAKRVNARAVFEKEFAAEHVYEAFHRHLCSLVGAGEHAPLRR